MASQSHFEVNIIRCQHVEFVAALAASWVSSLEILKKFIMNSGNSILPMITFFKDFLSHFVRFFPFG